MENEYIARGAESPVDSRGLSARISPSLAGFRVGSAASFARAVVVVCAWLTASAHLACSSATPPARDTTRPADTASVQFEGARRLSHAEYWNTLRDLFPMLDIQPTSLASDETIRGFSNNRDALVASPLLVEQQAETAQRIVKALEPHWEKVTPCTSASPECADAFVTSVGKRVFRRPLLPQEKTALLDLFELPSAKRDFALGQRLALLAMLQSPAFLYRFEARKPRSDFELANQLSYFIWASMPDDELFQAAESGRLSTREGVLEATERMLKDERARGGVALLFDEWLKLSKLKQLPKPETRVWNATVAEASVESARRFTWDLFERGGSSTDLITSHHYPVTSKLAPALGVEVKGEAWQSADVGDQRPGLLGHPAFLAAYAHSDYPSPVLRGVYVLDRLLCAPPAPPPNAFPLPAPSTADKPRTNREAYARATRGPGCSHCHTSINQLGFAFENFDAFGGYRTEDKGLPVESWGHTMGLKFENARELALQLSKDDRYHQCVAESWLRYALGGPPSEVAPEALAPVYDSFKESGYKLRSLVSAIAVHALLGQSSAM
jgi:hypothetical protein